MWSALPLVLDDWPKVPMHTNDEGRSPMNVVQLENAAKMSLCLYLFFITQGRTYVQIHKYEHQRFQCFFILLINVSLN